MSTLNVESGLVFDGSDALFHGIALANKASLIVDLPKDKNVCVSFVDSDGEKGKRNTLHIKGGMNFVATEGYLKHLEIKVDEDSLLKIVGADARLKNKGSLDLRASFYLSEEASIDATNISLSGGKLTLLSETAKIVAKK